MSLSGGTNNGSSDRQPGVDIVTASRRYCFIPGMSIREGMSAVTSARSPGAFLSLLQLWEWPVSAEILGNETGRSCDCASSEVPPRLPAHGNRCWSRKSYPERRIPSLRGETNGGRGGIGLRCVKEGQSRWRGWLHLLLQLQTIHGSDGSLRGNGK